MRRNLGDSARRVAQSMAEILASVQAASRGTEACINAVSNISGISADLDTTIMFANTGMLNAEEGQAFTDNRYGTFVL